MDYNTINLRNNKQNEGLEKLYNTQRAKLL